MARSTVFKQIKKLETLKRRAIKQLLASKANIEAELQALGHGADAAIASYKKAKKIQRKRDPNKTCKVCGEKGHDARRHRFEKKGKKAHVAA